MAVSKEKAIWRDEFYIDAYILAKGGASNYAISKALGFAKESAVDTLLGYKPILRYALETARGKGSRRKVQEEFNEYIYGHLSPQMKALWDKITYWDDNAEGPEKIQLLLGPENKRVRQQLWVHAMVKSNFNATEACRVTHCSKRTIDAWAKTDPEFPALLEELQWHKKNYFESALVDLAAMQNVPAIIFANRTLNKDRGYSETLQVQMGGSVEVNHNVISMDQLDLSLEVRVAIREAMRAKMAQLKAEQEKNVTPVEALEAHSIEA